MLTINKCILAVCLIFASAFSTWAGDYDGSKPLAGKIDKLIEINAERIIEGVDPEQAGLPPAFFIDFEKKTIAPTRDSLVRKIIRIQETAQVENKLMLQGIDENMDGVEDALGWTMAISMTTGKFVLSAAGDGIAYVVFGTLIAQ